MTNSQSFLNSVDSVLSAASSPAATISSTPGRTVRNRQSLPGGRALFGGLLVAVAAIGTFAAITGATDDELQQYVVAAKDLPTGTRLTTNDLKIENLKLSTAVAKHASHTSNELVGLTLLGPASKGELVQTGLLTQKTSSANRPELSFAIPSARALGGNLQTGETVNVVTSSKSNDQSQGVVLNDAQIVRVEQNGNSLGRNDDVTIVLSLASENEATTLARAIDQGSVTLVRTTGTTGTTSSSSTR